MRILVLFSFYYVLTIILHRIIGRSKVLAIADFQSIKDISVLCSLVYHVLKSGNIRIHFEHRSQEQEFHMLAMQHFRAVSAVCNYVDSVPVP